MASIINEFDFCLDNFEDQKIYTGAMAYAHRIKNLFFMRPGDFPSLPEAGINIQSYRFKAVDDLLSGSLKEQISKQLSAYIADIPVENINISTASAKGQYYLIISIVLYQVNSTIIFAIQQGNNDLVNFNFKIYDNESVEIW